MAREAGEPHTIRMPRGIVAQVRAASGMPFSRFVRMMSQAYLDRVRLEQRGEPEAAVAAIIDEARSEAQ